MHIVRSFHRRTTTKNCTTRRAVGRRRLRPSTHARVEGQRWLGPIACFYLQEPFFCARPTTSARSAIAFLVMRTSPVLRRRTDWKNRGRQTCKGRLKSQGSDQKNTSRPGRPCCRDEVCSKSYPLRNPDFLARRARKCRRFCGKTLRRNASIRIVRSFHQRSVR